MALPELEQNPNPSQREIMEAAEASFLGHAVFMTIAEALYKRNGRLVDLRAIIETESPLAGQIARLLMQANDPTAAPSEREFLAMVQYQTDPLSVTQLGSVFPTGNRIFDPDSHRQQRHKTRQNGSREARKRRFLVKPFDLTTEYDRVLDWSGRRGYDLALLEEAVCWLETHPQGYTGHKRIHVLGTEALDVCEGELIARVTPVISLEDGQLVLDGHNPKKGYDHEDSFLFVRDADS